MHQSYGTSSNVKQTRICICLIICLVFIACEIQFMPSSVLGATSNAGNGTLREWLIGIQNEANTLESSSIRLQNAIAILSSSNNTASIVKVRTAQLKKINQALDMLKLEISVVNSKCVNYDGPDCSIPICDSKCLSCLSPGQCSNCIGNFDGFNCASCKSGWKDLNCSIPVCDSKCLNCTGPYQCYNCAGNWQGLNCSTCKIGWSGSSCSNPVCDSKCTNCTSPGNCTVCSGNWQGSNCSTCKTGWKGIDCDIPVCDSKCTTCTSPGVCSQCSNGWTGATCSIPVCDSKCITCASPGNCTACSGNWQGTTCSTCKTGFSGTNCTVETIIDISSTNLMSSAQVARFKSEIINGVMSGTLKLLYKATRDTFASDIFHSKCDGKGATVVIVKSTNGAVFGGYAGVSWGSSATGVQVRDPSAFLFSIISPTGQERFTKLAQENGKYYKTGNTNYLNSLYHHSSFGAAFGGGLDLYIKNGNNCYSDLCYSYCDTNMVHASYGPTAAQSYLGGSYTFLLEDYEVYGLP